MELKIEDVKVGDELECIDRDEFNKTHERHKSINEFKVSKVVSGGIAINDGDWVIEIKELKYFRKKPKLQFSDLEVGDYVYVRDDLVDDKYYDDRKFIHKKMKTGLHEITSISKSDGALCILDNVHMGYTHKMIDLSRSMKKEDYLKMNEKENFSFDRLVDVARKGFKDGVVSYYGQSVSVVNIEANGEQRAFNSHFIKDGIEFVIETMSDELKIKSGAQLILSNGMKCIYFDDGERKLRHDGDYYPCNFLVLKGATVTQSK